MKTLKNTTPVPNSVFSCLPGLTGVELKLLLCIIRSTIGWINAEGRRKERDWIATRQFVKRTAVSERSVTAGIQSLIEKKLIKATDFDGNDLSDPKKRKFVTRIYYQPTLDNPGETTYDYRKNNPYQPQFLT